MVWHAPAVPDGEHSAGYASHVQLGSAMSGMDLEDKYSENPTTIKKLRGSRVDHVVPGVEAYFGLPLVFRRSSPHTAA
jgi:hypothetical protein